MVRGCRLGRIILSDFMLAQAAGEKLPPPTRAAVLMALLGIALLGMLIVVVILLGGHWVRRQGTHRRGPSVPPDRRPLSRDTLTGQPKDEWPAKGQGCTGDTLHDPASPDETKPK